MEKKRSIISLMLVDDPSDTFATLCSFKDCIVTKTSFTLQYESIKGRFKPIHAKNADTHFYILTTFKLLVPSGSGRGQYQLSSIAKNLCNLRKNPSDINEFQIRLSEILLNNERKGKIFIEFLEFVKNGKTKKEIFEKYKPITTSKTLIAWTKFAGMVSEYNSIIQTIPKQRNELSESDFKASLVSEYKNLVDRDNLGIKRLSVPIAELRFNLMIKLHISRDTFDDMLRKLLEKDFNNRITLYGSTSDEFQEEATFYYSNKLYIYLSMKTI
jgi:hypothetical protein